MSGQGQAPVSGRVFLVDRPGGAEWHGRFRRRDGRPRIVVLGPAWLGDGPVAAGYHHQLSAELRLAEIIGAEQGVAVLTGTGARLAHAAAQILRRR